MPVCFERMVNSLISKHHFPIVFIILVDPDWWDDLDTGSLKVDVIGVEKEIEMLPVFKVKKHNFTYYFYKPDMLHRDLHIIQISLETLQCSDQYHNYSKHYNH